MRTPGHQRCWMGASAQTVGSRARPGTARSHVSTVNGRHRVIAVVHLRSAFALECKKDGEDCMLHCTQLTRALSEC